MPKASLSDSQKERVEQLAADGFSQQKIAALFEVSQGTISNALKERRYKSEINKRDQMMLIAMTHGVKAAVAEGEITTRSNATLLDDANR